jgi:DNA mismatch endonuclease (patch repair protein)
MKASADDLRRRTMQAVKSRDTKPEMIVRRLIHKAGYRYRLHRNDLPGKPDLTFPKFKKIIFVHGCFWHGHDCKRGAREPKTNTDYWRQKINRNKARDAVEQNALRAMGWEVLVIWECQLKNIDILKARIKGFLGVDKFFY